MINQLNTIYNTVYKDVMILGQDVKNIFNKTVTIFSSLSKTNDSECCEYLRRIELFAVRVLAAGIAIKTLCQLDKVIPILLKTPVAATVTGIGLIGIAYLMQKLFNKTLEHNFPSVLPALYLKA